MMNIKPNGGSTILRDTPKEGGQKQPIAHKLRHIYAWMEAFLVKNPTDVRRSDFGEGPIGEILYEMEIEERQRTGGL